MQADNCHTRIYLVHVKTRSSCCFWAFFSSNMKIIFDLFSKMHRLSNNVRLSCNLHCDPISASHHVVILWMHFIVLYSLWNPMALYFHLPSWNRTKYNPWPLISALCFMVYTHTSRTHTHTHTCPYKITSFNLERPSPQLTERVRQKGRDWERWGRCKVINYLWVKSNKRQEFRWAAGILTDRQTDRQTDRKIFGWCLLNLHCPNRKLSPISSVWRCINSHISETHPCTGFGNVFATSETWNNVSWLNKLRKLS